MKRVRLCTLARNHFIDEYQRKFAAARSVPLPVAISERANTISRELSDTLAGPTATHQQQYQIALELFTVQRDALRTLLDTDLPAVEKELERLGAPYTRR